MMQKFIEKQRIALFLWLALFPAVAMGAELIASVDRSQVSIDETLTLTVRYSGTAQGQPDFSQLEKQFDVITRHESTSFRAINGQFSSSTEWTMVLSPLQEGTLLIPSFSFDGAFSDAIQIQVTQPQQAPPGELSDVFMETIINKSSAYVQEQIVITYRLYYAVNVDGRIGDDLKVDNAIVVDLEDTTYQREVDGRLYRITEFNYAVFPQSSGELVIPSLHWTLNIANYRIGRIEKRRVRTQEKQISVNPQPASFPADATWMPAENIEITETWAKDPKTFKVGEPITRTITLKADGLMASQLPDFGNDSDSGAVKFYPDQPSKVDNKGAYNITSKRVETAAVVINQPGEVTIPGVSIPWWDLQSNTLKYAEIPPTTIQVAGGPANGGNADNGQVDAFSSPEDINAPVVAPPGTNSGISNTFWQLATVLFAGLWLAFAFMWWRSRNDANGSGASEDIGGKRPLSERKALKELKAACNSNSLTDMRKKLLSWAQLHWPAENIVTLDDIVERIEDDQLKHYIAELESALYSPSGSGSIDGMSLYSSLGSWLKSDKRQATRQSETLGSLYP